MDVLEDPRELGRRVSAVRGYLQMQRPEFAERLGISVPTLRRWEAGEESALGRNLDIRRERANRMLAEFDIPEELVGIVSFRIDERIAELEAMVEQLGRQVMTPPGPEAGIVLGRMPATSR